MFNNNVHTLEEFYLHLKLDSWRSGRVAGWGRVERIAENDLPLKKEYRKCPVVKRLLSSGLYLLDLYLLETTQGSEDKIHIAVIAVCRANLDNIQSLCCLKAVNNMALPDLKDVVFDKLTIKR
jgi:hypothetical protein